MGDGDGAVDDEPPQAIANKRNAETTTRRNDDIELSENRRLATEITIDTTPPLVAAIHVRRVVMCDASSDFVERNR